MSNDPATDYKVKKKLTRILAAWYAQYKDDLSMKTAANLYKQHKSDTHGMRRPGSQTPKDEELEAAKRKSKDEARRKAKEEREAAERLKREKKGSEKLKSKRKPFNFEEVLERSLNIPFRRATELRFLGETKDPHADRGCIPIREQPRQRHHCGFFAHISLPSDHPDDAW